MPAPLRILFVAPFGLAHKTTVWARTLPLARELRRRGHDASILVPPWDSPADSGKSLSLDGVGVHNVSIRGGLPAISARLWRRIDQAAPDIVHVVKPRAYAGIMQWSLWQARRVRPTPALFLDIDDWEQPWAALNGYPWHVARFLAWQEEWGIRHADGISAASRWLAQRAAASSPQIPVEYLPNGIDIIESPGPRRAQRDGSSHDAQRVLWFTRFVETSPEWIGAFWQALQEQLPGVRLTVAGQALQPDGEAAFRSVLLAPVDANPADSPVEWLGYVERSQLRALFDAATCAIFPSDDTPLLQAKCSVRMATVLQHGVPIVASAVGEQSAYGAAGAAQLLAPEATPQEFARQTAELLRSPARQAALSVAAQRAMREHYGWPRLAEQLEGLYVDVLQHAR